MPRVSSQSFGSSWSMFMMALLGLVLGGRAAWAAWPDGYEGRVRNLDALRYDMAYPGVGFDAGRIQSLYEDACRLKSSSACDWKQWQGAEGGDLQKAAAFFESRCPGEPQSCVVMGWALSRDTYGNLDPKSATLKKAYGYFETACKKKGYAAGCSAMAEMHLYGIGVAADYALARKLADEGCKAQDPYGCYLVGVIIEKGRGTKADPAKAAQQYAAACKKDVPNACVDWARLLENGQAGKPDPKKAAELYGEYCNRKVASGCAAMARLYMDGKGVPRNPTLAENLYKTACDQGDILGCFGLATLFEAGKGGDAEDAAGIYEKACNIGHADACVRLGKLYLKGNGVPKDEKMGVGFVQRSCDEGSGEGCDVLGQLYESANGVPQDAAKAAGFYTKSCDGNEGRGCFHLAQLYKVGKGVTTSATKAAQLFQRACEVGHGKSCGLLGRNYQTGDGVEKSVPKAVEYYERGCAGGDGESCAKAGDLLRVGDGVAKDGEKAAYLLQSACSFEQGQACLVLAAMLEKGDGVPQDFKAAVRAYKDACDLKVEQACALGGKVVFAAGFQTVWERRFESQICQAFAVDPGDDGTRLVADVRGDQFMLMDGPLKGQTVQPQHLGTDVQEGKVYVGTTQWQLPGKKAPLKVSQFERWNPEEDPIDAFPGDESYSPERVGTTTLIFSRGEENVRRSAENPKCKFGNKGFEVVAYENCSEVQALLAAQLLTACKGE